MYSKLNENFIERKIKGNINETIIEFMLKDLGFYVIKLGQEHKVEPIVQLQKYFKNVNKDFNIYTNLSREDGFEQIRSLPDFLIVKNKYRPILLEVKYRSKGLYLNNSGNCKKLDRIFKFYPNSILLLTCKKYNYYRNRVFYKFKNELDKNKENLKTHFFVFYRKNKEYYWCSFQKYLEKKLKLTSPRIKIHIFRYDKMVKRWF